MRVPRPFPSGTDVLGFVCARGAIRSPRIASRIYRPPPPPHSATSGSRGPSELDYTRPERLDIPAVATRPGPSTTMFSTYAVQASRARPRASYTRRRTGACWRQTMWKVGPPPPEKSFGFFHFCEGRRQKESPGSRSDLLIFEQKDAPGCCIHPAVQERPRFSRPKRSRLKSSIQLLCRFRACAKQESIRLVRPRRRPHAGRSSSADDGAAGAQKLNEQPFMNGGELRKLLPRFCSPTGSGELSPEFVIASEAKQSSTFGKQELDCFVAKRSSQ